MKISALQLKANPTGDEGVVILDGDGRAKRARIGELASAAVAPAIASANGIRTETQGYRDQTIAAAALAQTALTLSNVYQTISAGLSATAPNGYFAIASGGDVAMTVYQKVNGAAVLVNILSSQAGLDRVGRFVPNVLAIDNSIAINAALAQASVRGVMLPAGDIRIDHGLLPKSGKFLMGAGRGVTRLIRTENIAAADYVDWGVVIVTGATGVYVADLDCVAPKLPTGSPRKVQGVWVTSSQLVATERVRAYNCGYSFWAQASSDVRFDDILSLNGNVHFETTAGTRVLFENFISGDGDGDNVLGCEAHCHCLYDSRDVTFRHGRASGNGHPILIVNDGIGLLDNIVVDDLVADNADGKVLCYSSVIGASTASVGRVRVVNSRLSGTPTAPGVMAQIQAGNVKFERNRWRSFSADNFQVSPGASLEQVDDLVTVTTAPGNYGPMYGSPSGEGSTKVIGGSITVTAGVDMRLVNPGSPISISPQTRITHPNKTFVPVAIGGVTEYTFKNDVALLTYVVVADTGLPAGTSASISFGLDDGLYQIRFRGLQKQTSLSDDKKVGFYFDGIGGKIMNGQLRLQTGSDTWGSRGVYNYGFLFETYAGIDEAMFDLDIVIRPNSGGGAFTLESVGNTLAAGSTLSIKKIA